MSRPAPSPAPADPPDRRPAVGRRGEELALQHLQRLGFVLVEQRARTRFGEIDLVVHDGRTIVFCEVKARVARRPDAWTSLHDGKQRQVRRLAAAWLASRTDRPTALDLRFDAITVRLDPTGRLLALDHVEGAF